MSEQNLGLLIVVYFEGSVFLASDGQSVLQLLALKFCDEAWCQSWPRNKITILDYFHECCDCG